MSEASLSFQARPESEQPKRLSRQRQYGLAGGLDRAFEAMFALAGPTVPRARRLARNITGA